jgi:D-sedoheptulose 7-phosphate isomerase
MNDPMPTLFTAALADHRAVAQKTAALLPQVARVAAVLREALAADRRLFTFGNGGSAGDAMHFATELVGRYKRQRKSLPAYALSADSTALTCIGNDYGYGEVFARQIAGLARAGDVAVGITTSGNSANVVRGLEAARQQKCVTVLLSAGAGGKCAAQADYPILVSSTVTARIQEMHILIIHMLCEFVDEAFGNV